MNYHRHYDLLIARAQNRVKPVGYVERHHILPRCMGGGNAKTNIAVLTAREHFVAHLLLVKMHPKVRGLACAAYRLATSAKHNSWRYAWVRARKAEDNSVRCKGRVGTMLGKRHSEETKRKQSLAQKGKVRPELIGRPCSSATRAKISTANKGKKFSTGMQGRTHSAEARLKMSAAKVGCTLSDATKMKMKNSQFRRRENERALTEAKRIMENAITWKVPMLVERSEGTNWGEAK